MFTCIIYRNLFYTSLNYGGIGNIDFVINDLAFDNIKTFACGPFTGTTGEFFYAYIHSTNNKQDKEMIKKEQQLIYGSPYVETIEIKSKAIICQSGEIDYMNRDGDEGSLFN